MVLASDQRCRACRRRIAPEGERRAPGVLLHSGRGLCWQCRKYSDSQVERIELARMYTRPPASWTAKAACARAGVDPELFYPLPLDRATAMQARQVCWRCPVMGECLEDALATGEAFGIRGGLTEHERARILKQRKADGQ